MKPIHLVIFVSLLVACSAKPSSPTPSNQPLVATATIRGSLATLIINPPPTAAPLPLATLTLSPAPTATSPIPTNPLPTGQPLLAYQSAGSLDKRLVLVDLSGANSWEFSFPDEAVFATQFLDGLSPDARYFVYYQGGTLGEYGQFYAEPPNLVMNVYDLDRQKVIFTTPLLSPEFPEDLKPVVEMTADQFWGQETDRSSMLEDMYSTMQRTVLNYLRTVAWSPDGGLLAFASQNPGPSSDMHYFSPYSGQAWRVTTELGHVLELTWAPYPYWDENSSAIALTTTLYDRPSHRETTDVLARAGTPLGSMELTHFSGWLDPNKTLFYNTIDFGDPRFDLVLLSVYTNKLTTLWEGSFFYFAVSPDLSSWLISSSEPNEPGQLPGLYMKISDKETPLHLSEAVFWNVAYWGSERFAYVASAPNEGIGHVPQAGGTFGISQTGEFYRIDDGDWNLLPSPDAKFLAAYNSIKGLRIFGGDGALLASLSDVNITCLRWNASSTSLAYQAGQSLYIWKQGGISARQIANQLESDLDYGECGFAWVTRSP